MSDDNLTTRVLIEIRDEIRDLRRDMHVGLERTNHRLEHVTKGLERGLAETNERIDRLRTELKDEIREVDLRAQTRMLDLIAATQDTNAMLRDRFELRDRVERCEQKIEELEKRVG